MSPFEDSQIHALEITERVASVFSLLGCSFIFVTFLASPSFRKPINRLVFYASWGNMLCNVATLISRAGIVTGENSSLCQFQGFLIQMFLPADAMWNLAMAINVYLTVFKKYNSAQLRSMEWIYLLACYGGTFIPAFVFCFISTSEKGKIYGDATLWCWVSFKWEFLRVAVCYAEAWFCIITSFTIYVLAGRDIFKKRNQLRSFTAPPRESIVVENPFTNYKTTEIYITSELVAVGDQNQSRGSLTLDRHGRIVSSQGGYEPYSVTIERGPMSPTVEAPPTPGFRSRQHNATMEANTAAWGYTKCALLFFVSLLITWVPSSSNRVYSLVHPNTPSWPLNYSAALVLPLMGFWNAVIYITISWAAVTNLFSDDIQPIRRFRSLRSSLGRPGLGHRRGMGSVEAGTLQTRKSHSSLSDSTKGLAYQENAKL